MVIKRTKIEALERGLRFVDGAFTGALPAGVTWSVGRTWREKIEVHSVRDPWVRTKNLDVVVKSGIDVDGMKIVELSDTERALVFVDGRMDAVIGPGLYGFWTGFKTVEVEVIDATAVRIDRKDLSVIQKLGTAGDWIERITVEAGAVGVLMVDGEVTETLTPGPYAFWRGVQRVQVVVVETREVSVDVAGQEIITADKVTLRVNAVATYRVTDAVKSVTATANAAQALYREVQLALRAVIGTRELDALLESKDEVADELKRDLEQRALRLGITLTALGIRDVILPGEMRELMNKVTEARKAAEAALITRREEVAAMRSQANTARMLTDNPTLMRLRELEVLEKIASTAKLTVVLGEEGLTTRMTKLL